MLTSFGSLKRCNVVQEGHHEVLIVLWGLFRFLTFVRPDLRAVGLGLVHPHVLYNHMSTAT